MGTAKSSTFQDRFRDLVGEAATQEEIAKKVNSSRQNVGNWLSGKSKPDINALAEIAKGYNVSTDYLLGLTDVKTSDPDVKAICEYTGLEEWTIVGLHDHFVYTENDTKAINFLFHYRFPYHFVKLISEYSLAYIRATEKKADALDRLKKSSKLPEFFPEESPVRLSLLMIDELTNRSIIDNFEDECAFYKWRIQTELNKLVDNYTEDILKE